MNELRTVLGNGELRPGIPVDAVLTVRKRTALQYLLEPLQRLIMALRAED